MPDLSNVLAVARTLTLSEDTVGTPEVLESLAALGGAIEATSAGDELVGRWLHDEHKAGGMLAVGASTNKRGEIAGKGGAFNRSYRSTLVQRYNAWAEQFVTRLELYAEGRADVAGYVRRLAAFHANPVHAAP